LLKKSLKKAAQSVEGWGHTRIEQASKERHKNISIEAKAATSWKVSRQFYVKLLFKCLSLITLLFVVLY